MEWLDRDNLCFADTLMAVGDVKAASHPHVRCMNVSSGRTAQSYVRLSAKILDNIRSYLGGGDKEAL